MIQVSEQIIGVRALRLGRGGVNLSRNAKSYYVSANVCIEGGWNRRLRGARAVSGNTGVQCVGAHRSIKEKHNTIIHTADL